MILASGQLGGLLFQNAGKRRNINSHEFSRYEAAYIPDEKLYPINCNAIHEKEEGYELILRAMSRVNVIDFVPCLHGSEKVTKKDA